jgi:hypothetical protein
LKDSNDVEQPAASNGSAPIDAEKEQEMAALHASIEELEQAVQTQLLERQRQLKREKEASKMSSSQGQPKSAALSEAEQQLQREEAQWSQEKRIARLLSQDLSLYQELLRRLVQKPTTGTWDPALIVLHVLMARGGSLSLPAFAAALQTATNGDKALEQAASLAMFQLVQSGHLHLDRTSLPNILYYLQC